MIALWNRQPTPVKALVLVAAVFAVMMVLRYRAAANASSATAGETH